MSRFAKLLKLKKKPYKTCEGCRFLIILIGIAVFLRAPHSIAIEPWDQTSIQRIEAIDRLNYQISPGTCSVIGNKIVPVCPEALRKIIDDNISGYYRVLSPYMACMKAQPRFSQVTDEKSLEEFLDKVPKTLVSQANNMSSLGCDAYIESELIKKRVKNPKEASLAIKMNMAAEQRISLKRLEQESDILLNEIASIDSIFGYDRLAADLDCRSSIDLNRNKRTCERLKNKCQGQGGFDGLASGAFQDLTDLEEAKKAVKSGGVKAKEAYRNLSAMIYADNPILKGTEFRKVYQNTGNIEDALRSQLQINRNAIKSHLQSMQQAARCLQGKDSSKCNETGSVVSKTGGIFPYEIGSLDNLSLREKQIVQSKLTVNHYLNQVQCTQTLRRLNEEQRKDVHDFGVDAALIMVTGGLGMVVNGSRVALATSVKVAAQTSADAGRLTRIANYAKTPLGAARFSVWGIDGATFLARDASYARHACDEKLNELIKISEESQFSPGNCPLNPFGDNPPLVYQHKIDYKSCMKEVALASLGLTPFVPDVVARMIRGGGIRRIVSSLKLNPKQIKTVAHLQQTYPDLVTRDFLTKIRNLKPKVRNQVLNSLENFDPKRGTFLDYWENQMELMVKNRVLTHQQAVKVIEPLNIEILANSRLTDTTRKQRARQILSQHMKPEDITDEILNGVLIAHHSHGKAIGELTKTDVKMVAALLNKAGITDKTAVRELMKRGITGSAPKESSDFLTLLAKSRPQVHTTEDVDYHIESIGKRIKEYQAELTRLEANPNVNPYQIRRIKANIEYDQVRQAQYVDEKAGLELINSGTSFEHLLNRSIKLQPSEKIKVAKPTRESSDLLGRVSLRNEELQKTIHHELKKGADDFRRILEGDFGSVKKTSATVKPKDKPILIKSGNVDIIYTEDGLEIIIGKTHEAEIKRLSGELEKRYAQLYKLSQKKDMGSETFRSTKNKIEELYKKIEELKYVDAPLTNDEILKFESLRDMPANRTRFTSGEKELLEDLKNIRSKKEGAVVISKKDSELFALYESTLKLPEQNINKITSRLQGRLTDLNRGYGFDNISTPPRGDVRRAFNANTNDLEIMESIVKKSPGEIGPKERAFISELLKRYKKTEEVWQNSLSNPNRRFYLERFDIYHQMLSPP